MSQKENYYPLQIMKLLGAAFYCGLILAAMLASSIIAAAILFVHFIFKTKR